jgi:hypothetical protein
MSKPVSFKCSKADHEQIVAIADRAQRAAAKARVHYTRMDAEMDVTACHCNGMPLNLVKLASFDDFNFNHDVFGIRRYLDRTTGKLTNCFVPRCAKPTKREAEAMTRYALHA